MNAYRFNYLVYILIFILLLTSTCFILKAPSLPSFLMSKSIMNARRQYQWNVTYESVIELVKDHEGYKANPYNCPAGIKTVGYGHVILKTDHFSYPISKHQADKLLRKDLDHAITYVERTTNLKHIQLLAMGHFVYSLGSGNFGKSTLKKLIISNKPIDKELLKWINIRTKAGMVKSDCLIRSRKMELQLFKTRT